MSKLKQSNNAVLGLNQHFDDDAPPIPTQDLVKIVTSPPNDTPLNAQNSGLVPKAPKKIPTTCPKDPDCGGYGKEAERVVADGEGGTPDNPLIALSAATVAWIKWYIPHTGGTTIRDHKRYTPYRETPPKSRIDKLLGDYMLGVGTPPDWDDE